MVATSLSKSEMKKINGGSTGATNNPYFKTSELKGEMI